MEKNKYLDITCLIINNVLNNKTLDLSEYEDDLSFIKLMSEQTLSPFLYQVHKTKKWKNLFFQAYLIDEKFNQIGKTIKGLFDLNNIDHIFLKGFELKTLYPIDCLRQMGDIDILVKEENYSQSVNLLLKHGFKLVEKVDHDTCLQYNGLCVEIHNKMLSKKEDFSSYFTEPFSNAIKLDGNTFTLNNNLKILYIIAHYMKHVKMGAGIRELIDIYLLIKKDVSVIEYLQNIFDKENKKKFLKTIFDCLAYIFVEQKEDSTSIAFLNYCLNSGIHGFGENSERTKNIFLNSKNSKIQFLLHRLFIPIKELFTMYPWTKSIILIPIGYLFRLIYLIKNRRDKLNIVLKSNQDSFFETIGL